MLVVLSGYGTVFAARTSVITCWLGENCGPSCFLETVINTTPTNVRNSLISKENWDGHQLLKSVRKVK